MTPPARSAGLRGRLFALAAGFFLLAAQTVYAAHDCDHDHGDDLRPEIACVVCAVCGPPADPRAPDPVVAPYTPVSILSAPPGVQRAHAPAPSVLPEARAPPHP